MTETFGKAVELDNETRRMVDYMESLFEEPDSIGCSYKDWSFEFGFVDFPAVIGGQRGAALLAEETKK